MRCAEERWIGDAGQWTAAVPVVEKSIAEDALTDAHDRKAFGFGGVWQCGCSLVEESQGRVGQADAELVGTIEGIVQAGEFNKTVGCDSRCVYQPVCDIEPRNGKFVRHTGMGQGQKPNVSERVTSDPDLALCCGGAVAEDISFSNASRNSRLRENSICKL